MQPAKPAAQQDIWHFRKKHTKDAIILTKEQNAGQTVINSHSATVFDLLSKIIYIIFSIFILGPAQGN